MLTLRQLFTFLFLLYPAVASCGQQHLVFTTSGNEELNLTVYPAQVDQNKAEQLFIWLPSEAGPQPSEHDAAIELSRRGIEVWQTNLVEDYFLPSVASSLDQLPANAVSELLDHALKSTAKQVFIVTTGRGAIPVLRGVRHWQLSASASEPEGFAGVILMSPKFYLETPDPGAEGKLMPIVRSSNLPVFILQPNKSPWYWKLAETVPALQQGGSDVFVRVLDDVRDRFNFRPDATTKEKHLSDQLAVLLSQASRLLLPYNQHKRQAVALKEKPPQVKVGKKDRVLQAYQGNPLPPSLDLDDLNGKRVDLNKLKGKVVLVNFWASWCPPCVYEMPSMQRLQDHFRQQPFTILGVNMAEDRQTIQRFLATKVKVDFPILLDSNGDALKSWGVFAFPTSYVIDKQGKIRYALFGGLEWDTPDIIEKISALLDE